MKICLFFAIPLPLVLWGLFHAYGLKHIELSTLSWGVYALIFGPGMIRGFYNLSATSLKPFLILRELYANGATWTTIGWQSGGIIGPMLGGFMLAFLGRETSFISVAVLLGLCFLLVNLLSKRTFPKIETEHVLQSLGEGFRFIAKTKIVLWAISLDLVSVLFGGVIALLTIFAEDILKIGPEGLGYITGSTIDWCTHHHDCADAFSAHPTCMAQYAACCCRFWPIHLIVHLLKLPLVIFVYSCYDGCM